MGLRRDTLLFPEGRKKALTFSYDDAVTQDVRFLELLNGFGLKGTFNINTGLLGNQDHHTQDGKTVTHYKLNPEEIPEVYAGQELAVHGLTHLDLAAVPTATAAYEVMADRRNIEEITKAPVRGMAYPFGTYSEELLAVLRNCQIEYARTVAATGAFALPEDFLQWHPTCHHNDERLFALGESFLKPVEDYRGPLLFYVWGHTYEFDVYDNWDRIETFMQRMSGHGEEIWYATNQEICDYVNAAKQLRYSANGRYVYNPTVHTVWFATGNETIAVAPGETAALKR